MPARRPISLVGLISPPRSSTANDLLSCSRLLIRKLAVNVLQSFWQMKHCGALPREQSVDLHAAFHRQSLETAPLQLVGDEDFTRFQLGEKHVANVERVRPGVGRRHRSRECEGPPAVGQSGMNLAELPWARGRVRGLSKFVLSGGSPCPVLCRRLSRSFPFSQR